MEINENIIFDIFPWNYVTDRKKNSLSQNVFSLVVFCYEISSFKTIFQGIFFTWAISIILCQCLCTIFKYRLTTPPFTSSSPGTVFHGKTLLAYFDVFIFPWLGTSLCSQNRQFSEGTKWVVRSPVRRKSFNKTLGYYQSWLAWVM